MANIEYKRKIRTKLYSFYKKKYREYFARCKSDNGDVAEEEEEEEKKNQAETVKSTKNIAWVMGDTFDIISH